MNTPAIRLAVVQPHTPDPTAVPIQWGLSPIVDRPGRRPLPPILMGPDTAALADLREQS